MGDSTLSQEEINALFANSEDSSVGETEAKSGLSADEIDVIGEASNISMGSAATALFALVNNRVEISTPVVSASTWEETLLEYDDRPCVLVKIAYTKGLHGSNVLVLKESDVKIITDLMMGGDGTNISDPISDLHLSAISEAMNQMMGASATSLSSMLSMMVDITPPVARLIAKDEEPPVSEIDKFLEGTFVKIKFNLIIDNLVDSHIMQLYPIPLARDMVDMISGNMRSDVDSTVDETAFVQPMEDVSPAPMAAAPTPAPQQAQPGPAPMPQQAQVMQMNQPIQESVNIQQAEFTPFAQGMPLQYSHENIDLIMDVPLEVTVELGRTAKSIEEILDFAPGTIIELNKIAGEPIDVLVNGKYVAKGEVVVIEEAFGVRITEITK